MTSLRLYAALCTLGAGTLMLAGCGPSVENSPAFQEQVSRLDRIEEDLKASKTRLVSLDSEFQQVSKDVATLVANGSAGGGDAAKALEARMVNIEKSMQALNTNFAQVSKQAAERATPVASKAAETAEAVEQVAAKGKAQSTTGDELAELPKAPTARVRKSARATAEKAGEKPAATVRRRAERAAEAPKSVGRYHMVQAGDTIEKLAAQYKSSVTRIQSANRLPAGRRLLPGQQIYIPGN